MRYFILLLYHGTPKNSTGVLHANMFIPRDFRRAEQRQVTIRVPRALSTTKDCRRRGFAGGSVSCEASVMSNIGALRIRIGSWGPLYYNYNKEPSK